MSFNAVLEIAEHQRMQNEQAFEQRQNKRKEEIKRVMRDAEKHARYTKPEPVNEDQFTGWMSTTEVADLVGIRANSMSQMFKQRKITNYVKMRKPKQRESYFIKTELAHKLAEQREAGIKQWWITDQSGDQSFCS